MVSVCSKAIEHLKSNNFVEDFILSALASSTKYRIHPPKTIFFTNIFKSEETSVPLS